MPSISSPLAVPFHDVAWGTDVDLAINELLPIGALPGLDYCLDTVGFVEELKNPTGVGPLTRTALREWVIRCKTEPEDERMPAHADRTIQPKAPDGVVHDPGT